MRKDKSILKRAEINEIRSSNKEKIVSEIASREDKLRGIWKRFIREDED